MNLSIIIVAYNIEDVIDLCLKSLKEQTYKDFEIAIIDNGSCDKTLNSIKKNLKYLPNSKLIQNNKNVGTCQARNQAIKIAKGKYVMTLDSDVVLTKDFLKKSIIFFEKQDKNIGIVGVKIKQLENKKLIDSVGLVLTKTLRFYDKGNGKLDIEQYDRKKEILGPCAAAALYKREMLEDIKENGEYFDSRFFYLVEDFDIALRSRDKGWKTIYYPEAICYHKRNGSGRNIKMRQYLTFRNRHYFLLKNSNFKKLDKNIFFVILYELFRIPFLLLTNPYTLKAIKEIIKFCIEENKKKHSIRGI